MPSFTGGIFYVCPQGPIRKTYFHDFDPSSVQCNANLFCIHLEMLNASIKGTFSDDTCGSQRGEKDVIVDSEGNRISTVRYY